MAWFEAGVTGLMAANHFAEGRYLTYFGAYALAGELCVGNKRFYGAQLLLEIVCCMMYETIAHELKNSHFPGKMSSSPALMTSTVIATQIIIRTFI